MASIVALGLALSACGAPEPGDAEAVSSELAGGKKACNVIGRCIEGYHWSDRQCTCVRDRLPKGDTCATDADCRLFSDYCTGCDCRVLGPSQADPVCDGPGVRCFADPCGGHTATCVAGSCTVQ